MGSEWREQGHTSATIYEKILIYGMLLLAILYLIEHIFQPLRTRSLFILQ